MLLTLQLASWPLTSFVLGHLGPAGPRSGFLGFLLLTVHMLLSMCGPVHPTMYFHGYGNQIVMVYKTSTNG